MAFFIFGVFLACFVVQMYFHVHYFRRLCLPVVGLPTLPLPAVSIIIASRNEARNLPALLAVLCRQDYPAFEIIVVNDRSTDNSADILAKFVEAYPHILKVIHIQAVPEGINPKKNALQIAIAQSQHDWLLLTDADCLPCDASWVTNMVQARKDEHTRIVLGISPLIPKKDSPTGFWLKNFVQYETFYTALQYAGFAQGGKPYMGVGRNLLYHKSLFEQVGGFGRFLQTTGGDDDLFINQVATAENTAIALEKAFVYSYMPASWGAWYRQKTRHLSVGKHYKPADQMRLAMLYASQGGLWAGFFLALIALPTAWAWAVLMLFCVRSKVVWQDYQRFACVLGCPLNPALVPLFDALFVPYLFVVGGLARFAQKVSWRG
jgi:cellulose synthase/poly-beta-1,6-N-acetylglucosamine synthase-like glycosyltransferase